MITDETLKLAVSALKNLQEAFMLGSDWRGVPIYDDTIKAIEACEYAIGLCSRCDCHCCECDEYE